MRRQITGAFRVWLSLVVAAAIGYAEEPADLVILGGQVVTLDQSGAEPEAVAARDGRLLFLGDEAEARKLIGESTKLLQLNGEMVMPGFIESHGHFVGMGMAAIWLDLTPVEDWSEIVEMTASTAKQAKPGTWIFGRGWHQEKWNQLPPGAVEGCPTHVALSKVAPNNPILFTHSSGHMAIVNEQAMRRAGIDRETKAPAGGEIVHDANGNPTGVLREKAQKLITKITDKVQDDRDQIVQAAQLASAECLANGVTSFQDAGTDFETLTVLRELAEREQIPVRLWIMIRDTNAALAAQLRSARTIDDPPGFTVRAVKRSLDGALGAHGAWLLQPYDDMTTSVGLNTYPLDDLEETARVAKAANCQLCVHAIGDRANRETLDLFERHLAGDSNLRWRIEHAQHIAESDIPRFGQLGVIAAMQGIHCTSDAVFVIERLGMRRAGEGAYVWRKLLDAGARICNGTDVPVEKIDPLTCFHATVTRELQGGTRFFPEQSMTRLEALRSYTTDAAYAAFEEDEKGTLAVGKLADMVILSDNLMTCDDDAIRDVEVQYTIVGGEVVYRAAD